MTTPRIRSTYDAVVVGARCAGAATAMLLARAGLRVLLLDRATPGSDTLSTHALMRGGVLQLRRWGLLHDLVAAGTPPVRTTTFHYGKDVLEVAIKDRDGVDALYAPRRTVLDPLLVRAAADAGVDVHHRTRLIDLVRAPDGRVLGARLEDAAGSIVTVATDIVVGADGIKSSVARLVRAPAYRIDRHASALIYAHWVGIENRGFHWYYRPGVSAGVIPTNHGATCVFAAMPPERFDAEARADLESVYHEVLHDCDPEMAEDVHDAGRIGRYFAFPGLPGYLRQPWGAGWALVGDAGYFRDPLTAHGMTDALRDAELLARAIVEGGVEAFEGYHSTRDSLAIPFMDATDRVASFDWDLESVEQDHLAASRTMNREVAAMLQLEVREGQDHGRHGAGGEAA